MVAKSIQEIYEQISEASKAIEKGGIYHGMSYEEGVRTALEWVIGDIDEKPMED